MKGKAKTLEDFKEYKKTFINSKGALNDALHFVKQFIYASRKPLKDFEEKDLINFINKSSKHYSIGSMNLLKNRVKTFIEWYCKKDLRKYPNLEKLCKRQQKEKTYSPEQMLSKEDVEKLVQEEPETRWKAFLLLFFYGGFRPSEVCNLEWDQISFAENGAYIRVFVNKNHKSFEKFVPENVSFYLKKLQNNNSEYVFPTKRKHKNTTKKGEEKVSVGDKPMTRSGVYQHLLPLARRVLDKHVNPYILRHSIATILYNRDDLKDDDTAQQMGHSTSMKKVYNNLSKEKIRERMKKIWIEGEDLPKEKKHKLEKDIENLKQRIELIRLGSSMEVVKKLENSNREDLVEEYLAFQKYIDQKYRHVKPLKFSKEDIIEIF